MLDPSGEKLRELGEWIEQGKLRTVVGGTAVLTDVEGVTDTCMGVFKGRGRIRKNVTGREGLRFLYAMRIYRLVGTSDQLSAIPLDIVLR